MNNILDEIKTGKANFQFSSILSEHNGYKLYIDVFRDALKIDGIRRSATAIQLQQIADYLGCMMLTPKIVDLIWFQAKIKFNSIVNINGKIVANLTDEIVSFAIDKKIESLGGDDGESLIDSVGKYWVLVNELSKKVKRAACNYGWPGTNARYNGITKDIKVWQPPGFKHNDKHVDPSQTIRLMARFAKLVSPDGSEEYVDMYHVLTDEKLSPLASHQGKLTYLRQASVQEPSVIITNNGTVILPETIIYGTEED